MNCETVQKTADNKLCISCGLCKGICPNQCISYQRQDGMFIPLIDNKKCTKCGLCANICPSNEFMTLCNEKDIFTAATGKVLLSCNAWSKDAQLRHVSASGGTISSIVRQLLQKGFYDAAFCVKSYTYKNQVATEMILWSDIQNGIDKTSLPKSRYIAISHENAITYAKKNRDKRIIFIGTSCVIRGFEKSIDALKLNRENYLLIGLFCDKIFNYNIWDYFSTPEFCKKQTLDKLHFKNKDSGCWPGNMKFIFSDGSSTFHSAQERVRMKQIMMPERCMYCVDKLNVYADISVGDNFTTVKSSKLGSNSVIIRTNRGKEAWHKCLDNIETANVSIDEIQKAQALNERIKNANYATIKYHEIINNNITCDSSLRTQYSSLLNDLLIGANYQKSPHALSKLLKQKKRSKKIADIRYNVQSRLGTLKKSILK